jgi:hypothetical protein
MLSTGRVHDGGDRRAFGPAQQSDHCDLLGNWPLPLPWRDCLKEATLANVGHNRLIAPFRSRTFIDVADQPVLGAAQSPIVPAALGHRSTRYQPSANAASAISADLTPSKNK